MRPHRAGHWIKVGEQKQNAVLVVMQLAVAGFITLAAVEMKLAKQPDERLEELQALNFAYLTALAHESLSPHSGCQIGSRTASGCVLAQISCQKCFVVMVFKKNTTVSLKNYRAIIVPKRRGMTSFPGRFTAPFYIDAENNQQFYWQI